MLTSGAGEVRERGTWRRGWGWGRGGGRTEEGGDVGGLSRSGSGAASRSRSGAGAASKVCGERRVACGYR